MTLSRPPSLMSTAHVAVLGSMVNAFMPGSTVTT